MDTRATTRTRLSAIPVLIALLFNLAVPVLTAAVPEVAPEPLQPIVAEAAVDPEHVNLTLQGCREPSVNLELTGFVCADADYTPGNLGKTWNELDLVPHRLTTSLGSQATATETYTIGLASDYMDGGHPGYDVMSQLTVNAAKSHASCSISSGAQQTITPGVGGTDSSIGRLLTITQAKGSTCVFDLTVRLALGSHLFPGSSLHTNRTNQLWSTSGIGAADVSIPVNEILPQELSKDMSAEQGQLYTWAVDKSASPASLDFANTCLTTAGARSQQVQITVTWTRSGPTGSGDTTITTHVYATNPAHRTITVQATDRIYEGAGQAAADLLDTVVGTAVDVPAGAEDLLILTHSFVYSGSATTFNDVATATYTDKVTGVAVPGQTSAAATATTVASSDPAANASVLVTDTESISGDGLSFSVAAPALGAFTGGYVAGATTTGPVGWQYTASSSGSVTFTKTVTVDQARATSGSLTDTATIVGDGQVTLDTDSESVAITADALVSLQISKTIPAGSLRAGETVTFDFDVAGPGGYAGTAQISFAYGDPLTKSTTVTGLEPGSYTVSEDALANWAAHVDQSDTITLPDCAGSVAFNNSTLAPALTLDKSADDASVSAGQPIGFLIDLANSGAAGTGIAKDVTLDDPLPGGDGIAWAIDSVTGTGGYVPAADACAITGSAPTQTLECDFGDLNPGEGVEIAISSDTDGSSCGAYTNVATVNASNHAELTANDTTEVLCADLELDKTGSDLVVAGDDASFTLTVTNHGEGTAMNVVLTDELPGTGLGAWTVTGTENIDANDCAIAGDELTCSVDELASGAWFSVTVTATTDAGACPSIANDASVVADDEASDDQYPNTDSHRIAVDCPDVRIDKEPVSTPISAGQEAEFTILVWNDGPGTAYDVEVTDTLPAGTIWQLLDADGMDCETSAVIGQQWITCSLDELGAGAHNARTIRIGYETTADDCGELDNAVAVTASNEPSQHTGNNSDEASIVVECPGLNIVKTADADPIDAGEEASFTITVWNAGPGDAFDVELADDLPAGLAWDVEVLSGDADCDMASSILSGEMEQVSIECDLGTLEPSSMAGGVVIRIFADTDRNDCGLLENTAFAWASNNDEVSDDAEITVRCPTIGLDKENDAVGSVLPGTTVTYTLTLTISDGPAEDVTVVDFLPVGLESPMNISDGGTYDAGDHAITWDLGDLADGDYTLTYEATVADDVEHGAELVNAAAATSTNSQCPDLETLGPECEDDSTVIVRVPTLVLDKVADTELITLSGPANAIVASPSIVTWTLSWTLANGPVTDAVITDEVPDGFVFLDASDGGTLVDGVVTWNLGTLSENGSVTFRTTVDVGTISRTDPTVNVAVIDSNETEPDDGTDSVRVIVEPPPLAGTPTPKPSMPNTATGVGPDGTPVTVPVELLAGFFLASLGALALANVTVRTRRR